MAKRITFSLIVLLIASALVFVSCSQDAAEGGKKIPPKPAQDEPVENVEGTEGENILEFGSFECSLVDIEVAGEESTLAIAEGVGVDASKALSVVQNVNYSSVLFDLTPYYGRGKSYYIEASFKNDDSPVTDDLTGRISFSVVSGAVYDDKSQPYYDADIVYSGEFLDSGEAEDIFGYEVNDEGGSIDGDEWATVCGIIPATEIDRIVGNSTLYQLQVSFYVGTYSNDVEHGQKGYKYLIDNIVIKDLNTELDVTGSTYGDDAEDEEENLD